MIGLALAVLAVLLPAPASALTLGRLKESVYTVDSFFGVERSVSGQKAGWEKGNWKLTCSFTPLRVIGDCVLVEHQYLEKAKTSSAVSKREYSLTNGLLEVASWDPRGGVFAFNVTEGDEKVAVAVQFETKGADLLVKKFTAHGAPRDERVSSGASDFVLPEKSYVYQFPVYMAGLE